MAGINVTAEELRSKFNYCPSTGVFSWAAGGAGIQRERAVGSNSKGYILMCVNGKRVSAHRMAWLYVYGVLPNGHIDHINGDRADNRIANLRVASFTLNNQNQRKAQAKNKSGYLGVYFDKNAKKWRSHITVNNKKKHLGLFDDSESAYSAYVQAKRVLHPGCTI